MTEEREKAQELSLAWIEEAARQDASYTVAFNALAMFAVSMLIPYMQDNNIPVTRENVKSQMERVQTNINHAADFYTEIFIKKEETKNGI